MWNVDARSGGAHRDLGIGRPAGALPPSLRRLVALLLCALVLAGGLTAGGARPNPTTTQVYIQDSPVAQDLIDRARRFREQDRLVEAARAYQQVIEQHADKLIPAGPGRHVGAARWVGDIIAGDEPLRQSYVQLFEPDARRRLEGRDAADEALLERLLARHWLCPAGLDAGLRLAGLYLERGRPRVAAVLLDDLGTHEELAARRGRFHLLQAAAGLFGRDQARLAQHERALADTGDDARLDRLAHWSGALALPEAAEAPVAGGPPPQVALPEPFGKPIWSRLLRADAPELNRSIRRLVSRQRGLNAVFGSGFLRPVAVGDTIVVVARGRVLALDRSSGRDLWSYAEPAPPGQAPKAVGANVQRLRIQGLVRPVNGVCAAGDRVMAVLGHAGTSGRRGIGSGGNALVCLGRRDGAVHWRVEPADLDEALAGALFQGPPLAIDGKVVVAVRRQRQANLMDVYVVALDVATGRARWQSHLASAASTRPVYTMGAGASTALMATDSAVYAADALGVVASLEPRSGAVRWLVRAGRAAEDGRAARSPDLMAPRPASPMRVPAGLVLPPLVPGQAPMLLDPDTGQKLRDLTGPGWTEGLYFLRDGQNVLSIGDHVRRVDGRTLKVVRNVRLPAQSDGAVAGTPVLTSAHLLVPRGGTLVQLDRPTLGLLRVHEVAEAGEVLALPDQVILAGIGSLHSYMNWDVAARRLRSRIASGPVEPGPGLALAHLAMSTGNADAVLEGVDAALRALPRPSTPGAGSDVSGADPSADTARETVFTQLLAFVRMSGKLGDAIRPDLFDRLAAAATGPADHVAYHLALGEWLERGRKPDAALEQYQFILSDRTLSEQWYDAGQGSRRAGQEARLRQAALVQRHPAAYERYGLAASQRLAQLRGDPQTTVAEMLSVADQFPIADAAVDALLDAAGRQVAAGDTRAAAGHLRRAYALARMPAHRMQVISRLVALYSEAGRPGLARRWLGIAARRHRGLELVRGAQQVSVTRWLAELDASCPAAPRPATFGPPLSAARARPQRLLVPVIEPEGAGPADLRLLEDGRTLSLCEGPSFTPRWTVPMAEAVELLVLSEEQILLHERQAGRVLCLDSDTGAVTWAQQPASSLLSKAGDREQRLAGRPRQAVELEQILNPGLLQVDAGRRVRLRQAAAGNASQREQFVVVNDQVICLFDTVGRAVGLDRDSGEPLWRLMSDLARVDRGALSDDVLVLAGTWDPGRQVGPGGKTSGAFQAIDALSGRTRFPRVHTDHQIRWIGFDARGSLVCATANQVFAHEAEGGRLLWSHTRGTRSLTGEAHVANDQLLFGEAPGFWHLVDLARGEMVGQVAHALRHADPVTDVAASEGYWHLLSRRGAITIAVTGRVAWRDAVDRAGKNLVAQFISRDHVVLLDQVDPVPRGPVALRAAQAALAGKVPHRYRLYILDRQGGGLLREYELPLPDGPIDPARSRLLGDQMLLVTPGGTITMGGPSEGPVQALGTGRPAQGRPNTQG